MELPQYQPDKADYLPLTDDELQDLDDWLSELPTDAAMNIEALDGYLSALQLSPVSLSDKAGADWMAPVWGGGDPFTSGKQRKRISLLLLRHVHSLSVQWTSKQAEWEPIFSIAEEGEQQLVDAEDWCTGFMIGVDQDGEAWGPLFEHTKTAAALAPIALLGGDEAQLSAEDEEKLADLHWRDALSREVPEGVLTLWTLRQAAD
ncbi:uncharacterized protein SAMN05216359_102572 [Roseateles sp. YR242]|uniref:UPF0149 family protein n=1 Tax=Roseateles sp. YR242 TaxID=1855305 RepID=UPI0008C624D1|nr:UPF0149 family protein [Roseateles sp. YR242]SEK65663.1 uncharacterized protein SAMN05216359_102572 [Roseateles sp. YR242]